MREVLKLNVNKHIEKKNKGRFLSFVCFAEVATTIKPQRDVHWAGKQLASHLAFNRIYHLSSPTFYKAKLYRI